MPNNNSKPRNVLPLVLKGKWYDMIASGEKKEEYRDLKPFWINRIGKWHHQQLLLGEDKRACVLYVAFSRGYKKADLFFEVDEVQKRHWATHRDWGEPDYPHFVLKLGKRIPKEEFGR